MKRRNWNRNGGVFCLGVSHAVALLSSPQVRAAKVAGIYRSPLGNLRFSEKDDIVRGTYAGGKNPCGFKKGKVVIDGTRLDDSITGTLTACKVGPSCSGDLSGMVMLYINKSSRVLSGAVYLDGGACHSPLKSDGITIKKRARRKPIKKKPPKDKPSSTKTSGQANSGATKTNDGGAPQVAQNHADSGEPSKDQAKNSPTPHGRAAAIRLAKEAWALLNQGKVEDAREKFEDAVEADPEYAEGFNGIGVTYYLRGRYDEALEQYKRGLEADPANKDVYYNIACIYALQENKEQALNYLQIALLNGYVQTKTLETDGDLKSLQGDPTFEKFKRGEFF